MKAFDIEGFSIVPLAVAFLTGVAGPALVTYIKHKLNLKKAVELLKRRNDFNLTIDTQQKINKTLNEIQQKHGLDRIWIAQFHNGGNFYPGNKSMKKLSVTFESTKPGISTDILKLQNLPVSFFSSVLQIMNKEQIGYVVETENSYDNAFADFWVSRGITRSYLFPVICIEGGFIAVLGVDYINRDDKLPVELYEDLEIEAKQLSGYVAIVSVEKH
jgi:hypothetical protein